MKEVWEKVVGYDGYYLVSNLGQVRSVDRLVNSKNHSKQLRIGQMCKQRIDRCGYLRVGLRMRGTIKNLLVHRLVAEAFIPNPENRPQVNHKNGVKTDNCVKNLEWVTASENTKHKYIALGYKSNMKGKFGKDNPTSKIVLQIKDGVVVAEFYGTMEAQRKTGIKSPQICQCCSGYKGAKTAGGYEWKYK